jgi:hypothetical protein
MGFKIKRKIKRSGLMEEEKEKTIFLIDLEKAEYPSSIYYSLYNAPY